MVIVDLLTKNPYCESRMEHESAECALCHREQLQLPIQRRRNVWRKKALNQVPASEAIVFKYYAHAHYSSSDDVTKNLIIHEPSSCIYAVKLAAHLRSLYYLCLYLPLPACMVQ
jgi:hypothetical protein